jgi:hypothetical protein
MILFGEYADPWRKKRLKEMSENKKSPGENGAAPGQRRTFSSLLWQQLGLAQQ